MEEVACTARRYRTAPSFPARSWPTCPSACASPFERTGGLHTTGLFDANGQLLLIREDVGRHNAMDKVVGRALLEGGCRSTTMSCA